ncbi:MAG: helix-turn-helix domain-containing protein [archaeon]
MEDHTLEQLGLNFTESRVYFALLTLGKSTVGPIIKEAKIPASKIYFTLDKLKEKGLVASVIQNNVNWFIASDPKQLLGILAKKRSQLSELESDLKERIIPMMEAKAKDAGEKQEAIVYESIKGMAAALDYMLSTMNKGETYYVLSPGKELNDKQIAHFYKQYHSRRVKKGIHVKILLPIETKGIIEKYYAKNFIKYMKYKYTSQKIPQGAYIFPRHIILTYWSKAPTAFVIKSKNAYLTYKEFFEEIWENTGNKIK